MGEGWDHVFTTWKSESIKCETPWAFFPHKKNMSWSPWSAVYSHSLWMMNSVYDDHINWCSFGRALSVDNDAFSSRTPWEAQCDRFPDLMSLWFLIIFVASKHL